MMKKLIIGSTLALVFLLASTITPSAQAEVGGTITKSSMTDSSLHAKATTTTKVENSTLEGLFAQLAKLTALYTELKEKIMGTKAEIKELRADIKEGMQDEDIKTIQELLASDPTIYPRGLITGYFGPMTKEAISKFQAKNNLEVTGEINEETRAAIDAMIEEKRANGKFPIGLLFSTSTKDKFAEKLKFRCDKFVTATTTAEHQCLRVMEKYDFWKDQIEARQGKAGKTSDVKRTMKEGDKHEQEADDVSDDN